MKITNFWILTLLTVLFSCSQGTEKTNVKVSIAAISGSANFPGGLFLYGKNKDTNIGISKRVPAGDTIELELENGHWGFVLVGWDGSQYYEGNNYCDFTNTPVSLEGDEKDLSFEVSREKCASKWINGTNENVIDFYSLNIHSCSGIQDYLKSGSTMPDNFTCDGSMNIFDGGAKYFAVSLAEFLPETGVQFSSKSRCIPVSSSKAVSNIKLPYSSDSLNAALIVQSFKDSNCSNLDTTYVFQNGMRELADGANAIAKLDSTSDEVNLYTHAKLCNDQQKTNPIYGASFDTTHLICNADQFENISLNINDNFILGADIDMSGATSVNDFRGNLDGGGFTFYDGENPLFVSLIADTSDIEIKDFNIKGFSLSEAGTPIVNAFGILAHQIDATNAKNVTIQDINIDQTSSISLISATIMSSTYLGGLVGYGASTNTVTIRDVHSSATVSAGDSDVRVGGLFGKIYGYVSKDNFKIETSSVGTKNSRANISGVARVGGLVGQIFYSEISEGVKVYTNLEGEENTGGLIGDADEGIEITNTLVDTIYSPVPGLDSTNIGGVIGSIPGDKNIRMEGVVSKIKISTTGSGEQITKLGGFIGAASSYESAELSIRNSKVYIDSSINGSKHGGFIGEYSDSVFVDGSDGPIIYGSVVEGKIGVNNNSSGNNERAGFIGSFSGGRIERSIANLDLVTGYGRVAGAFGSGYESRLRESFIRINEISSSKTSGDLHLAGLIGEFDYGSPTGKYFDSVIIDVNLIVDDTITDCSNHKCGKLYGEFTSFSESSDNFINIVSLGHIENRSSAEVAGMAFYCGDSVSGSCSTGEDLVNFQSIRNTFETASCTATVGSGGVGFSVNSDNNCSLSFERQWHNASKQVDKDSGVYTAGNMLEPFDINTVSQWNQIGDDVFLMDRTFELQNSLNFGGVVFTPVGSLTNSFRGKIIPNGKSLSGIDHTATTLTPGIFPKIENATIGWYGDPLIIEGLNLDCGGYSECGTIGRAEGGNIFAVVRNGYISGNGSSLGGLVGYGEGFLGIKESFYQGEILASGSSIGGLVGQFDGELNIEETAIYLDQLTGADNLGGVLGQFKNTGNSDELNIKNSYIVFDEKGSYSGDNFNGSSGTQMGVLFGYAAFADINVDNFYMDTRNLVIGNGALRSTYNIGGGTPALNEFYKIGIDSISGFSEVGIIEIPKSADALNGFESNNGRDEWVSVGDELYLSWETAIFNLTNS